MALDPKFLEWFGQMLILSAKNLEQAESFLRIFREGLPPGTRAESWLEPYLSLLPQGKETAAQDFQALARELFRNLGVVSRQEYDRLLAEHEQLKTEFEQFRSDFRQVRDIEDQVRETSPDLAGAWMNSVRQVTQANVRMFELYQKWFGLKSPGPRNGKKGPP